jgi:hypothetical protein
MAMMAPLRNLTPFIASFLSVADDLQIDFFQPVIDKHGTLLIRYSAGAVK